ncbi:MAG: LptF/LptG family permease [Verrucomicrobiaceae bacterium]|nr:LptF/LptG family permease [Verrucomicrobiaceae bacterium]
MHRWRQWQQTLNTALGKGVRWLRRAPNLEAWAIVLGVVVVLICQALGIHEHQMPWLPSSGAEVPREWQQPAFWTLFYDYVAPYLKLIALMGGFVLNVAVIRARRIRRLIVPTMTACCFLAMWLVLGDIYEQWQLMHGVMIGKPFSLGAYALKLILIMVASLTPAVVLVWYERSPIWERYLLRSMAAPLTFCMVAFCSLWVLADLLDSLRDFQDNKVGAGRILSFYFNLLPSIFVESAAPALLLALLHAMVRLVKSNEMVALQSAGVSTARVLRPFWLLAAVVCLISAALNYDWAQKGEGERDSLTRAAADTRKKSAAATAIMRYLPTTRRLWFVSSVPHDLRHDKLKGIEVRQFDEHGSLVEAWSATSAWRWRGGMWTLSRGLHSRYEDGLASPVDLYNIPSTGILQFNVTHWTETIWDVIGGTQSPEVMGVPDLVAALASPGTLGDQRVRLHYNAQIWHRVIFPWQALALVFVVSLLPPLHSRQGLLRCVGIGIALYLGLMFLNSTVVNVARSGRVPAPVALIVPHLILVTAGLVILRRRSEAKALSWASIPSLPRFRWRSMWRLLRGRRTWKSEHPGEFFERNPEEASSSRIRG